MKTITLTDKQHEKLVDILGNHTDEGPRDYGWDSQELIELREVVQEFVLAPRLQVNCDYVKLKDALTLIFNTPALTPKEYEQIVNLTRVRG